MYYCESCKNYFDEPARSEAEADTGYVEQTCPICGNDSYIPAKMCVCGKNPTHGDFCDECYEMVKEELEELKMKLGFEQDDFEQIISNHFGW